MIGGDLDLHIILEGMTPTGSSRFRRYRYDERSQCAGIRNVCCASTGTLGMAAAYPRLRDTVRGDIAQGKITPVQLAQPLVHGPK
jgi:threonine synthase